MFDRLSISDKFALTVSSCSLAAVALLASLKLTFAPSYADFIVGNITWSAGTKFQDLIAAPVFISVLFSVFLFLSHQLFKQKQLFGDAHAGQLSNQWIVWSLPSMIAVASLILDMDADKMLFIVSALGIGFIAIHSAYNASRQVKLSPELMGLSLFALILAGLWPLDIALILGRMPMAWVGEINLDRYVAATYGIVGFGMAFLSFQIVRCPEKVASIAPKWVLAGQLGLPPLFLTLYPARLLPPDGVLTHYETTLGLKIIIVCMVLWGFADVMRRYRSDSNDPVKLFSPIALFALLIGLRVGHTVAPSISPDDYHFGEGLLGWWSYLHGFMPYLDYIPAHGLVSDDLTGFLSYLFYDGSAASMGEAGRLSFAVLAFAAFIALYLFFENVFIAFVLTFFIGGVPGWQLVTLFLTVFICIWLNRSLSASPSKWLSIWGLTVPVVILGVPPQGLLLVAASGAMAARFAWLLWRNPKQIEYKPIGLSLIVLLVLGLTTPWVSMLLGAIRYVLENGSINQVAYGVPWTLSWGGAKAGFVFELVRMSWVFIPLACLAMVYEIVKHQPVKKDTLFSVVFILLFALLLIPYSMGRIDPGALSRPGLVSIFGWAVLLPIALGRQIKPHNRAMLIACAVFMCAALDYSPLSFSNFDSVASSKIATGPLRDGKSVGLPNIGLATVQQAQWDRLKRLNELLNAQLAADETYLDLTSRNAQYFYLNRMPAMAVTAPYNMVSAAQQQRAIAKLSSHLPRLVLLEGDNIIQDGGGLALRNPHLYRFIMEHYTPRLEQGFIVGAPKKPDDHEARLESSVKDFSDVNWDRGFHRLEPALIVEDDHLMSSLSVGAQVRIGTTDVRSILRIWKEGHAIWFDGPIFDAAQLGYPDKIRLRVDSKQAEIALFEKAFAPSDLAKIPLAWGRSKKSLENKMTPVQGLDGLIPTVYQLALESGNYRVEGIDPQLSFDVSALGLSGRDAGLLKFDFYCAEKRMDPRIQVFWWGDDREQAYAASSMKFNAENGTLIVPLDASPRWLMTKHIKGIRIDLDNASACSALNVRHAALFQRH